MGVYDTRRKGYGEKKGTKDRIAWQIQGVYSKQEIRRNIQELTMAIQIA